MPSPGYLPEAASQAPWGVGEATGVYRPRHPERTGIYRIFEQHFDEYIGTYEERFEHRSGPLLPSSCGRDNGKNAGFTNLVVLEVIDRFFG